MRLFLFFFDDQKKRAYIQVGDSSLFVRGRAGSDRSRSRWLVPLRPARGGSPRRGRQIQRENKTKTNRKKPPKKEIKTDEIEREREIMNNTLA